MMIVITYLARVLPSRLRVACAHHVIADHGCSVLSATAFLVAQHWHFHLLESARHFAFLGDRAPASRNGRHTHVELLC